MKAFKLGDVLTSHKPNGYQQTGEKCECVVTELLDDGFIQVVLIKPGVGGHRNAIDAYFCVDPSRFVLVKPQMGENE